MNNYMLACCCACDFCNNILDMDENWMRIRDRLGMNYNVYAKCVKKFLEFAYCTINSHRQIIYPCKKCKNLRSHKKYLVGEHLFVNSINYGYTDWILHGEPYPTLKS